MVRLGQLMSITAATAPSAAVEASAITGKSGVERPRPDTVLVSGLSLHLAQLYGPTGSLLASVRRSTKHLAERDVAVRTLAVQALFPSFLLSAVGLQHG
jgi:hypothetical protein